MTTTRRSFLGMTAGLPAAALGYGLFPAVTADTDTTGADSASFRLPRQVWRGVSRAVIFDGGVTDPSVYDGRVAFSWGSRHLETPPDVLPSRYVTIDQDAGDVAAGVCCGSSQTLEWFQANHPDWVVYRSDRTTQAANPPLAALDITNPAAREFYIQKYIDPAIADGWPVIALDHVNAMNYFGRVGHYDLNGNWVHMYGPDGPPTPPPLNGSGPGLDDPTWQRDQLTWLRYLVDYLHSRGVAVAANINAPRHHTAFEQASKINLIEAADIWVDEQGFIVRWGEYLVDDLWQERFDLMRRFAQEKAIVSINATQTRLLSEASRREVNYAIASYLLVREPRTMLALLGYGEYGRFPDRAELNFDIGLATSRPARQDGIWVRQYSRGITLVNPASSQTAVARLPFGVWQDSYGQQYSRQVDLAPASGLVLKRGS